MKTAIPSIAIFVLEQKTAQNFALCYKNIMFALHNI